MRTQALGRLNSDNLVRVINTLMRRVGQPGGSACLPVVSQCLQCISSRGENLVREDAEEGSERIMHALEVCDDFVQQLLRVEAPEDLVAWIDCLRESPKTADAGQAVRTRALDLLRGSTPEQYGDVAYQLLRMAGQHLPPSPAAAAEGRGGPAAQDPGLSRARQVQAVVDCLVRLDRASAKREAQQPAKRLASLEGQGDVLLFLAQVCQQDLRLAEDWLKALKADPPKASPFFVASLLALARARKLEHDALSFLRQLVTKSLEVRAP